MTEQVNPYASPVSDPVRSANAAIRAMDDREVKLSHFRSNLVHAFASFISTVTLAMALLVLVAMGNWFRYAFNGQMDMNWLGRIAQPIALLFWCVLSSYGLFARRAWGRFVGIINEMILIITMPILPFIGDNGPYPAAIIVLCTIIPLLTLFILIALWRSACLFGRIRLEHNDLELEAKCRKAERKRVKGEGR